MPTVVIAVTSMPSAEGFCTKAAQSETVGELDAADRRDRRSETEFGEAAHAPTVDGADPFANRHPRQALRGGIPHQGGADSDTE
jgi:hypothetical protein